MLRGSLISCLAVIAACKFPELPQIEDAPHDDGGGTDATMPGNGGQTVGQVTFRADVGVDTLGSTGDGGVVMRLRYSNATPLQLAGTTIPCTSCEVVVKLNGNLSAVDWYAYTERASYAYLSTSPSHDVYWALETFGDAGTFTQTIHGSRFAGPVNVTVPGGADSDTGGARIVVAFTATGDLKWHHVLTQTNTATGNYLDGFRAFAASDDTVLSSFSTARGTIAYRNDAGAVTTANVAVPSMLVHDLDAANGRTRGFVPRPRSEALTEIDVAVGTPGYQERGFIARVTGVSATGTATGSSIMLGAASPSGIAPTVTYNTVSLPAGQAPNDIKPARLANLAAAFATVSSSYTLGNSTFDAPSTNGDALYAVLDTGSATVRAARAFGGSASDWPTQLIDAGRGHVYCVGQYRSTDLVIGGSTLPSPPDAASPGIFVTLARIDLDAKTLVPVWTRGYVGNAALKVNGATASPLSGDLYVHGTATRDADLGGGPITDASFVVRISRGD